MENSSSDSRRRTRLETRQPASVNAMGTSLVCEVRNYCRLGLFLRFTEPQESQMAAAVMRPGILVEVVFTATLQGQPQLLRIVGTVAHLSAAGAGLSVPSMPPEALLALQAASQSVAALPAQGPSAGVVGPSDPGPALQAQCMTQFDSALRDVFKALFAGLDVPFDQAHDKNTDAMERKALREAPSTIRFARPRIEKAFFENAQAYQQQLRQEAAAAPTSAAAAGQTADELSLLEESEFEDWLNLTAVVNRLESDGLYGPKLVLVERLFGRLVGRLLDRRSNPFGPAMICQFLQQAARELPLNNGTRSVLYRAFGQVLQRQLPALVDLLAEALSAWGENLDEPAPEKPLAPASSVAAAQEQQQPQAQQEPEELQEPQEPLHQSLLAVAHGLLRAVDQMQGGAAPRDSAPQALQARSAPEARPQDLLQLIDATMAQSGWMGLRETVQTPFSVQLSNAGGGLGIPPQVQNALDSVASLLVQAQAVSGGGAAIDGLLKRLERPLLKLALREDDFLDRADHPARQVVDLLEQFAVAVDDDGRFIDASLQRFLNMAVERVWTQADQDPQIYTRTRDSMARLLEPLRQDRQTRVTRVLEACESRHRFRQARQRVDRALDARLGGALVPQVVLSLLDAGWRQALVLLEFRVGEEAEQWHRELDLVDQLVALLAPDAPDAPDAQEAAASTLERRRVGLAASSRVETLLASVNTNPEQRDALITELQRTLDDAANGREPPQCAPYVMSATTLAGEITGEIAGDATGESGGQVRVGDWWFVLKDSAWLPMQLIWTSGTAQDCALTNRSATRHLELTLQDFHKRVREGTVKEWSDQAQPLVERSVQAMLDEGREQVLQRSQRDPVTGLLNRKGFLQRLSQVSTCRNSEHTHLLAIVEFDQFRVISQACGVAQGEALARALSGEVRATLGQQGVVASFRDDTLAVLLPDARRSDGLARLDGLLDKLSNYRFQTGGQGFSIGLNMGVADFTPGLQEPDAAVQQADMACVAAKTQGRNRLQCFEAESQHLRSQQELVDWAGRIDSLLSGSGLHLRGQMVKPISADSGLKTYYEVLLGIELSPGRTVSPQPFVMALEGLRRAHELDLWVLHKAFDWIRKNQAAFAELGGFSINLSAMSLANTEIIDTLRGYLLAGDIPAERISFEITESAAIQSYGAAADFIRQMSRFGCRFALDDFGSGHTSYGHLKNLRADVLKIDGSFVKDIVDNPADFAIVKSMNDIAHSLGMRTVAEYVESPAILAKLKEIGVDYAQGYAVHKPCRMEQLLVREAPQPQPQPASAPLTRVLESAVAVA